MDTNIAIVNSIRLFVLSDTTEGVTRKKRASRQDRIDASVYSVKPRKGLSSDARNVRLSSFFKDNRIF